MGKQKPIRNKTIMPKMIILFFTAIFMSSYNSENKIAIEDANFDEYFFNEKNKPVVKGKG